MAWSIVWGTRHGAASDGRHGLSLVYCRLGVHVLGRSNVSQLGIVCGLGEIVGI